MIKLLQLDLIPQLHLIVAILVRHVKPEPQMFVLLVLNSDPEHQTAHVLMDISKLKIVKFVNLVTSNVRHVQILLINVTHVMETELVMIVVAQLIPMIQMKKFVHHAQMNVILVN